MSRDSLVWIYNLVKKIGFSAEKIVELSGCNSISEGYSILNHFIRSGSIEILEIKNEQQ